MWDEQERFARGIVNVLAWTLGAIGVATAGVSLDFRSPAIFLTFLQFLAILACLVLTWTWSWEALWWS